MRVGIVNKAQFTGTHNLSIHRHPVSNLMQSAHSTRSNQNWTAYVHDKLLHRDQSFHTQIKEKPETMIWEVAFG